jgi:hypothetical protein
MPKRSPTGTPTPPGLEEIVDLWQKQFSAGLKDPRVIEHTLGLLEQMTETYRTLFAKTPAHDTSHSTHSTVSASGSDELALLKRRISALESRIKKLEAKK